MDPVTEIIETQIAWARRRGIPLSSAAAVQNLADNLFVPLSAATRREFELGAGNELGSEGVPGTMTSLRSSSALVVNVFEPWRGRDLRPLAEALGSQPADGDLAFEVQLPTGLRGVPPHLDVVLSGPTATPLAIEAKFTEAYGVPTNTFRPSYFQRNDIWRGLPHVRQLAESITTSPTRFQRLGAAQLVKHVLGLARAYGPGGFELVYLWYEWPSAAAEQLEAELQAFGADVSDDVRFRAVTYQDVFARLAQSPEPVVGYHPYLRERYFATERDSAPAGEPDRRLSWIGDREQVRPVSFHPDTGGQLQLRSSRGTAARRASTDTSKGPLTTRDP